MQGGRQQADSHQTEANQATGKHFSLINGFVGCQVKQQHPDQQAIASTGGDSKNKY